MRHFSRVTRLRGGHPFHRDSSVRLDRQTALRRLKRGLAAGYRRLEYWSQDRGAQRYYARLGLKEIGRHYRFRFKPTQSITDELMKDFVGVEYCYGACTPEEWPLVKKKFEILEDHPLEPHLSIGYEMRW